MVDVERVVRMLDHRDAPAVQLEVPDELLDQRGLAGAGEAAETDDVHSDDSI